MCKEINIQSGEQQWELITYYHYTLPPKSTESSECLQILKLFSLTGYFGRDAKCLLALQAPCVNSFWKTHSGTQETAKSVKLVHTVIS